MPGLWLLLMGGLLLTTASMATENADVTKSACLELSGRLGSVKTSDCELIPFASSGFHSVDKRPILIREYLPPEPEVPRARILLVGGIHGDELSSISIVVAWMRELEKRNDTPFHWRITPSMNPDGLLRRPAQRMNLNGVDLNRNFPTPDWENSSRDYWVNRTKRNPRRYPGPKPLSEPESQWLYHEMEHFRPDAIVAVHAPFGIVDFDGPANPPRKLGQLYLNLLGTYPGSLGNFAGVQRGVPVITVELPYSGILPSAGERQRIWRDLQHWLSLHVPVDQHNEQQRFSPAIISGN